MDAISGVYAILGRGNRVYVGESKDILKRNSYDLALRLDLPCGIVREFGRETTKAERLRIEHHVIAVFRNRGFVVVSTGNTGWAKARAKLTTQQIRRIGQLGGRACSQRHDRKHYAEMGRLSAISPKWTPEKRSATALKTWETRREKYGANGRRL